MPTVDESFEELRIKLTQRELLRERGGEPIYYLVFPPQEMLRVKRRLDAWKAKLESKDGWNVHELSLARRTGDFLRTHRHRESWLEYERIRPGDYDAVRKTLASLLAESGQVTAWVEESIAIAAKEPRGLVLLTDIEAIHPYLRIGAVEQSLQGRCTVPLVILYPGTRSGHTILRFLGEYPEDGNYRSLMVGG